MVLEPADDFEDWEHPFECEYCHKEVDGTYVDRAMTFCNPTCAMKQAEEKWEKAHKK